MKKLVLATCTAAALAGPLAADGFSDETVPEQVVITDANETATDGNATALVLLSAILALAVAGPLN